MPAAINPANTGPGFLSKNCQKASTWFLAVGYIDFILLIVTVRSYYFVSNYIIIKSTIPGNIKPASWARAPAAASIATLQCFNSASLIQYRSTPKSSILDKPRGSKPRSPAKLPSS